MKHLSICIDEKEYDKLKSVAKHEYRSVNKQVTILIRDFLAKTETKSNSENK